ncbi:MAG TPA: outer membrane beta-barrel protein [Rubricoccaceae bacterium]|jgi:hypothetical protein
MRVLLLLALTAATAHAQTPDREGFGLGARVYAAGLSVDSDGETETDTGGGLDVRVSYGFNRTVLAFFNLGGARLQPEDDGLDSYILATADLGAQFNILPSNALNPYLRVALTGQTASFDIPGESENLEARGGGLTAGVGLLYAANPKLSLDLSLDATGGQFSELAFDGESTDNFEAIDSGIARFGVGLVFMP